MQMPTEGNVVLYLDKELVEKSKELGFNLSKTFENNLKHLINGNSTFYSEKHGFLENKSQLVGLPGFEPESIEPKSTSLDQASRQPQMLLKHNFQ
jgi:Post-segregation antitoxin CcdA